MSLLINPLIADLISLLQDDGWSGVTLTVWLMYTKKAGWHGWSTCTGWSAKLWLILRSATVSIPVWLIYVKDQLILVPLHGWGTQRKMGVIIKFKPREFLIQRNDIDHLNPRGQGHEAIYPLSYSSWLKATKFCTAIAIHLGEGGFFSGGRLASALPRI